MNLREVFTSTLSGTIKEAGVVDELFQEIQQHYSESHRHYHTLSHLENLIRELEQVKSSISDYTTVLLAVFYHDIIYDPGSGDNEQRSADLAERRLKIAEYPADRIDLCKTMILATKAHQISDMNDVNLFTDADLSILGRQWDEYETYARSIRKEFSAVPDLIYKGGRKGILKSFLTMPSIFKTEEFRRMYEASARSNLKREIELLS